MMERWLDRTPGRVGEPCVGKAYCAAIASCDQSRQKEAAHELFRQMHERRVNPRRDAYNAAILACRHEPQRKGDRREERVKGERSSGERSSGERSFGERSSGAVCSRRRRDSFEKE